jgi:DNA processing protein
MFDGPHTLDLDPPEHQAERRARLRLARGARIGPVTFHEALAHFGSARAACARLAACTDADIDREEARLAQAGGRFLVVGDAAYPGALAAVPGAPPILSAIGDLALLGRPTLALVGARDASLAGRRFAAELAAALGAAGFVVVSGLARGIDTSAHEGALDAPGRTVAVLGCGLDRMYPPENERLAGRITFAGAVVSEFALGTPPLPEHFPRRNRVIAGWGRAVVVVEAAARSGALNTARCAADEGRDVLAVPGHPTQPASAGTNQLIRDGAGLVRSAIDVAQELGIDIPAAPAAPTDPLLGALAGDAPATLEELRDRSGLETGALLARLTDLELRDVVRRLPGPLFVRHHQVR